MAENNNDDIFNSYDDYLNNLMKDDNFDMFAKDELSKGKDLVLKPTRMEKNILPLQVRAELFAELPSADDYVGGYYQEEDDKGEYLSIEIKTSGNEIRNYGDHLEVSENPEPEDVMFMVADAKAHGWNPVEVDGDDKFMAKVWLECQRQGLILDNYKPSKDLEFIWLDEQDANKLCEEKAQKKSNETDVRDGKALAGFMNKGIKKSASGGKSSEIPSDKRPLGRFLDRVSKLEDKPAVKIGLTLGAAMVGPYAVMGYGMMRTYKDFRKELKENKDKKKERAERIMEFMAKGVDYDKLPADLKKEDKWGGVRPWLKLAARTTIYASSFAAGVTVCSLPVRTVLAGGYGAAMLLHKTKAVSWVKDKITGKKKEVDENKPKLTLKEKLKASKKQLVEAGVQTAGIFAASIVGSQIHHNWDDISQSVADMAHTVSGKFHDFTDSVSKTSGSFMDKVGSYFESNDFKVSEMSDNVQTQKPTGFFGRIFSGHGDKSSVENTETKLSSHNSHISESLENRTTTTYKYPEHYKGKLIFEETRGAGSASYNVKIDSNDGDALATLKALKPSMYESMYGNRAEDPLKVANMKDSYNLYQTYKAEGSYSSLSDSELQKKAMHDILEQRKATVNDNVAKFETDKIANRQGLTDAQKQQLYSEKRAELGGPTTKAETGKLLDEKDIKPNANHNNKLVDGTEKQTSYSANLQTEPVHVSYQQQYEGGFRVSQQNGQYSFQANPKDDVSLATLKNLNPEQYNKQFVHGGKDPLEEMTKQEAAEKFKAYKKMDEYSGMSRDEIKAAAWNDTLAERQEAVQNNLAKFYTDKWVAEHPGQAVSKDQLFAVAHKQVETAYSSQETSGLVAASNVTQAEAIEKVTMRDRLWEANEKAKDVAHAGYSARQVLGGVEGMGKSMGKDINLDKAQGIGDEIHDKARGVAETTGGVARTLDFHDKMQEDIAKMKTEGVTTDNTEKVLNDQLNMVNRADRAVTGVGDVIGADKVDGVRDVVNGAEKSIKNASFINTNLEGITRLFKGKGR